MWLIYPLYTLNWLYIRDFRDFFGTKDNYVKRVAAIPKAEVYRLFAAKAFNLFYLLALPMIVLNQPGIPFSLRGWQCTLPQVYWE